MFADPHTARAPFDLDLYTVSSDGTGLTRLTSTGAQQPAPCANGSIAFVHRRDVYLLSPDRRTQRRLTLRGGNSPDCSPDGLWIAFVRKGDLYLISSSGRRVRRLTTHHALDGRPAFSPTGQQIAFTATFRPHYQGTAELAVIDLRGRVRWKRTVGACPDDGNGYFCDTPGGVAWQPLGKRP